MSIYADLLFMHGHIVNVELARQLAGSNAASAETTVGAGKILDGRGYGPAGGTQRATPSEPGTRSNR